MVSQISFPETRTENLVFVSRNLLARWARWPGGPGGAGGQLGKREMERNRAEV